MRTIHCVSLGCPKNRVDSEVMLGVAQRLGYRHVADAAQASVIVVNTCGFIEPAKRESIDTILELAEHKRSGACAKLVVTGCLSQRHGPELEKGLPEVDHFLGSSDMLRLADVLAGDAERLLIGKPADWVMGASDPRQLSTRRGSAYLKLAEGCNRSCAYCVIPGLRGKQRSRPPADIVREAERLRDLGVIELNLVSQDTVAYGRDLDPRCTLAEVVHAVAEIPGISWIRLFYLYPEQALDPALVALLRDHPRVLPYVDMPLQHAADAMLRRMRRGHGGQRLRDLVSELRDAVPELVFRTAFIVGHPGETDAEFQELVEFVEHMRFDRVGVFRYSDEHEARASSLPDKVSAKVAHQRARRLMSVQRPISRALNLALVGRELDVLVEGRSEDPRFPTLGRHAGQAPEIDGAVYLSGRHVAPGTLCKARITGAGDYDLVGEVRGADAPSERPGDAPGSLPESRPESKPESRSLVHRASDGRRVTLRTL